MMRKTRRKDKRQRRFVRDPLLPKGYWSQYPFFGYTTSNNQPFGNNCADKTKTKDKDKDKDNDKDKDTDNDNDKDQDNDKDTDNDNDKDQDNDKD